MSVVSMLMMPLLTRELLSAVFAADDYHAFFHAAPFSPPAHDYGANEGCYADARNSDNNAMRVCAAVRAATPFATRR